MSKSYFVFVEATDFVELEAPNEDMAKADAVEAFKDNVNGAAFNATVIRETLEDGTRTFPDDTENSGLN